jgi:hypothetical protein
MITDYLADLNWLAVIVAALAWFAFSSIWYSVPPLSQAWAKAARVDTSADGPSLLILLVPTFIAYLVTTIVIALLVEGLGITTVDAAIVLGASLGVGFGLASALVTQLYERKGGSYWLINGVNAIIAFGIVAVILALWE